MNQTKKEPEKPRSNVWVVTVDYTVWRFTSMVDAVNKAKQLLEAYPSGVHFVLEHQ